MVVAGYPITLWITENKRHHEPAGGHHAEETTAPRVGEVRRHHRRLPTHIDRHVTEERNNPCQQRREGNGRLAVAGNAHRQHRHHHADHKPHEEGWQPGAGTHIHHPVAAGDNIPHLGHHCPH
ncbi:hypothetical protein AL705_05365 [Lawsonella clevelandensis]|uniref:Uncharacterized protein n=1 Tax=Lawsonella clevelandensis TaxID=1528099 RepID=A0A0M4MXX6_9ACTN|nr:hypothetical protein AL705_05365 [Lawsonella clevelandensis]